MSIEREDILQFKISYSVLIFWTEARVARRGGGEVHTEFWWGNLRERDHLEDKGIDERIIKKCIFS